LRLQERPASKKGSSSKLTLRSSGSGRSKGSGMRSSSEPMAPPSPITWFSR
jgi:hypothetical protein